MDNVYTQFGALRAQACLDSCFQRDCSSPVIKLASTVLMLRRKGGECADAIRNIAERIGQLMARLVMTRIGARR